MRRRVPGNNSVTALYRTKQSERTYMRIPMICEASENMICLGWYTLYDRSRVRLFTCAHKTWYGSSTPAVLYMSIRAVPSSTRRVFPLFLQMISTWFPIIASIFCGRTFLCFRQDIPVIFLLIRSILYREWIVAKIGIYSESTMHSLYYGRSFIYFSTFRSLFFIKFLSGRFFPTK